MASAPKQLRVLKLGAALGVRIQCAIRPCSHRFRPTEEGSTRNTCPLRRHLSPSGKTALPTNAHTTLAAQLEHAKTCPLVSPSEEFAHSCPLPKKMRAVGDAHAFPSPCTGRPSARSSAIPCRIAVLWPKNGTCRPATISGKIVDYLRQTVSASPPSRGGPVEILHEPRSCRSARGLTATRAGVAI